MGQKDTKEILDKLKLVEERIITAIKLKNWSKRGKETIYNKI
jgi:hypothetical protein